MCFHKRRAYCYFKASSPEDVDNITAFKPFIVVGSNWSDWFKVLHTLRGARMGSQRLLGSCTLVSGSRYVVKQQITSLVVYRLASAPCSKHLTDLLEGCLHLLHLKCRRLTTWPVKKAQNSLTRISLHSTNFKWKTRAGKELHTLISLQLPSCRRILADENSVLTSRLPN